MRVEINIKELEVKSVSGVEAFPSTGFFKLIQTEYNLIDLVFVDLTSGAWIFISPWDQVQPIFKEKYVEEKVSGGNISEELLLKTIAMLANKEKLSEL